MFSDIMVWLSKQILTVIQQKTDLKTIFSFVKKVVVIHRGEL